MTPYLRLNNRDASVSRTPFFRRLYLLSKPVRPSSSFVCTPKTRGRRIYYLSLVLSSNLAWRPGTSFTFARRQASKDGYSYPNAFRTGIVSLALAAVFNKRRTTCPTQNSSASDRPINAITRRLRGCGATRGGGLQEKWWKTQ